MIVTVRTFIKKIAALKALRLGQVPLSPLKPPLVQHPP